ncbi:hypothetical protein C0Q70_01577 [Pomacea canaliculata]|uniref:Uncharacterized protein n=1 Tax=Pomacea canaliculata TaxID=400727 RepID=A0A2T7PZV6_POMCA|nr:hypothetical protein C0Q70_01577 [Pomacea canaliculata]
MTKSATTMSAAGSSSGRGQRMRLRLTMSQLLKAIKKLSNQRGYSLTSIRNRLCRDVGKYSIDQINSVLQRAIQAGRVKEITEDRFSLLRHINEPASQASSYEVSEASTSRESRGRRGRQTSGTRKTTSQRRNIPGFRLRLVVEKPSRRRRRVPPKNRHRKRSGRVPPSNQPSRHAAGSKNRRQQQPKRLQQGQRQRCMSNMETAAACDNFPSEDEVNDHDSAGADD